MTTIPAGVASAEAVREKALHDYRKKLIEHKEVESRLKESKRTYLYTRTCPRPRIIHSQLPLLCFIIIININI